MITTEAGILLGRINDYLNKEKERAQRISEEVKPAPVEVKVEAKPVVKPAPQKEEVVVTQPQAKLVSLTAQAKEEINKLFNQAKESAKQNNLAGFEDAVTTLKKAQGFFPTENLDQEAR